MPRTRFVPALLLAALLAAPPLHAVPEAGTDPEVPPAPAVDREVDRLVGLCKAWTAVKVYHPWLYDGETDWNLLWDRAFVDAVPAVREAETTEDLRSAVADMLAVLDDPVTRVEPPEEDDDAADREGTGSEPRTASPETEPPLIRHLDARGAPDEGGAGNGEEGGVSLLDAAGVRAVSGGYRLLVRLRYADPDELLEGVDDLIVDLRVPEGLEGPGLGAWAIDEVAEHLVPDEVTAPAVRWPVHWGYRPQEGTTSGAYETAFAHSLPRVITPSDPDRAPGRLVFLFDEQSDLPEVSLALRAAGRARFVAEGGLGTAQTAESLEVELADGVAARVRTTEPVPGTVPFGADVVVEPAPEGSDAPEDGTGGPAPERDPALDAALELLAGPWGDLPSPAAAAETTPARPRSVWRAEHRYPEMTAPSLPWRLLAGCRLWGTIDTFYPYLHLIGDWEGAFRAAIPELLAAPPPGREEEAYVRALLHLATEIEDGHTFLRGEAVERLLGNTGPPIRIREVDGSWVVTEVQDRALDAVRVGDVIEAVDGVPYEERIAETRRLVTASTDAARRYRAAFWSLFGAPDTELSLTLRGADGARRTATLHRGRAEDPVPRAEDPPFRILDEQGDGGEPLGYVDLTRLQVSEVDPMFEALGDTAGLVLDLRGYPHGTAWALAGRLNTRGAEVLARFRRREVSRRVHGLPEAGLFFAQPMPPRAEPLYRGEVVVLIDRRAISQAEHTALALEAAADVVFVGTPTAGTNGDVTTMALPGDLLLWFTGHDVRHADGRQLQRVGIQPDVPAEPTLEGIRTGRDEVLDRGVEVLRERIREGPTGD